MDKYYLATIQTLPELMQISSWHKGIIICIVFKQILKKKFSYVCGLIFYSNHKHMEITKPVTVQLSLPPEQLALLEQVKALTEQYLAVANDTVWLTEDQAGARFQVTGQTIKKWRLNGWLRYIKDEAGSGRGLVRYRVDWLDEDVVRKLGVMPFDIETNKDGKRIVAGKCNEW